MLHLGAVLRTDASTRDARVLRLVEWPHRVVPRKATVHHHSTTVSASKGTKGAVCAAIQGENAVTPGTNMDRSQLASLLRIQNMIMLCKHLKLPVTYKVVCRDLSNSEVGVKAENRTLLMQQ